MNPVESLTVVAPTPFFTEGGCSYRVLEESRAIQRSGTSVRLFTYPTGRDMPGLKITRPRRSSRQMGIGMNPVRVVYDSELLHLLLRSSLPKGSLHVHLHEGAFLARVLKVLKGRSFVADLEGSFVEEAGRTFPWLSRGALSGLALWFEEGLERSASEVIVSSAGLHQELTRRGHIPRNHLHLIADGVDPTVFTPAQRFPAERRNRWRGSLGIGPEEIVVIYVGAISPEQGIDAMLDRVPTMVKESPRLRIVIYGGASQFNSLDQYRLRVRREGLEQKVLFPGPIPFEQVPDAVASADLAVSWKRSYLEGSGKVPLYMAAGIPTIALWTPAHAHYLGEDGSRGGYVSRDYDRLAEALVRLAGDVSERTRLGVRARSIAEKELSWDVAAGEILRVHARNLD